MTTPMIMILTASADWWIKIFDYEIIRGNALWRFALVLLVIVITLAASGIIQFLINGYASRKEQKDGANVTSLLCRTMSRPIYVGIFAAGIYLCKMSLEFDDKTGIRTAIRDNWTGIAKVVSSIAIAYALYRLVDVVEYYLVQWVSKTHSTLDDMLVPVVRKAMRVTIAIISILYIAENVVGSDKIKSLLLSAGIGGIAIALAAKETIANFFGSVMIFADKPFQISEVVKVDGRSGTVEDVGFRSTRIRTSDGHLVTIPNSVIANSTVENVGRRPFIRRESNIAIAYGAGYAKAKRAVEIIKEILAAIPQVNADAANLPQVYLSDFGDWSLKINMSYVVKPPNWRLYQQINEQVNLEIMKRFEAEKIEFACPSGILYAKKDQD